MKKHKLINRKGINPLPLLRHLDRTLYPVKNYLIEEVKQHFGIDAHVNGYDDIRRTYLWLFKVAGEKMVKRISYANGSMLKWKPEDIMNGKLSLKDVTYFDFNDGSFYIKISNDTYIFVNIDKRTSNGQSEIDGHSVDTIHLYFFGKGAYYEFAKYKEFILNTNYPIGYLEHDCRTMHFNHEITNRPRATVFMKDKDKFIQDVKNLKALSDTINKKGITFSPGILLYGEPGCGKSTIIAMLASELNADVITLKYRALEKFVDDLIYYINNDKAPSKNLIVSMEDIDILFQDREDCKSEQSKIVLNNLFQFLDGCLTVPGIIVVATTNHIERLDPALIRDGRFDIKLEVKGLDEELAKEMCKSFDVPYDVLDGEEYPINPAYLQGKILKKLKATLI